jgi:hypothetical protein
MTDLPEPRRSSGGSVSDPLLAAARRAAGAVPLERLRERAELRRLLAAYLTPPRESELQHAIAAVPDAATYRVLADALAEAIDDASASGEIVARAFALPIVLVCGATQAATIPGRLRDVSAFQALFERTQVLGATRSFGLADALCTLEALAALSPLAVLRSAHALDPQALAPSLPSAPIRVQPRHEQAHLRFVLGMGLTAAHGPSFHETAADIGRWGRECAELLQSQLAVTGVQLAALPRPPTDLVHAPHAGRHAQLETALNLFMANALRRFRLAVGDPVAIVSAHEGGEIRLTLSSPFADELLEGFSWPLARYDRLGHVQSTILELCSDTRLSDVRVLERLLPAKRANGALWYPRHDEWEGLAA